MFKNKKKNIGTEITKGRKNESEIIKYPERGIFKKLKMNRKHNETDKHWKRKYRDIGKHKEENIETDNDWIGT